MSPATSFFSKLLRRVITILQKTALWSLAIGICLAVIGYIILLLPVTQNYLLQKFTTKMSNEWNRSFEIREVSFNPLSYFKFYDFCLLDHNQDTLLYAKSIEIDNWDLWSMWSDKQIDMEKAVVKNAVFKIQRLPEERFFSLDFIIDYFNTDSVFLPPDERFKFSIMHAKTENVRFEYADAAEGTFFTINSSMATALADTMDLIGKHVRIKDAFVSNTTVSVVHKDPIPIPDHVPPSPYNTADPKGVPDWFIKTNQISVDDSYYSSSNLSLNFKDVKGKIEKFSLEHERFTGNLVHLEGHTPSYFELESLSGEYTFSPKKVELVNFRLETSNSSVGHSVTLTYDDYKDFAHFEDKIWIDASLYNSQFRISDVAKFVPSLLDNFFVNIFQDVPISVTGNYEGYFKDFKLNSLDIDLGKINKNKRKPPSEWLSDLFKEI